MAVRIIKEDPSPEVLKQVVCKNCGVTLEYTPFDVTEEPRTDISGATDIYREINCPKCATKIQV